MSVYQRDERPLRSIRSYMLWRLEKLEAVDLPPPVGAPEGGSWPSEQYREDPVGFFRNVLGFEPWEKQIAIAEMVRDAKRDGKRVAVSSGHKVGKSTICGALALWFYCCFVGARVVLTASTARQVDGIIWREVRMLLAHHGRCVACKSENIERRAQGRQPIPRPCPHSALIDGEPGDMARTGLVAPDFREIKGFTAKEAEAVAGVSGANLLYLCDEASGIPATIFEAIEGNRAGGATSVLIGNPTRLAGEFFEAFHVKKDRFYRTMQVSSEQTPNVLAGRIVVPGLATKDWVDEKREEWGEESAIYSVRVKGEFPKAEVGAVFPLATIEESKLRWSETKGEGALCIGIDPSGKGPHSDESGFAARVGLLARKVYARRGLSEDGHLVEALGLVSTLRERNQEVRIIIDREGEIGAKVWGVFVSYLADKQHAGEFVLVGVRASERATRDGKTYDRVRDELVANLADWMREGGAIPEESKLEADLNAFRWVGHISGRNKLADKDEMRADLGRSPDRADALALAVWGERSEPATAEESAASRQAVAQDFDASDPYAMADAAMRMWRRASGQ